MPVQYLDVNDHYKDQCLARVKAFLETEEEGEGQPLSLIVVRKFQISVILAAIKAPVKDRTLYKTKQIHIVSKATGEVLPLTFFDLVDSVERTFDAPDQVLVLNGHLVFNGQYAVDVDLPLKDYVLKK